MSRKARIVKDTVKGCGCSKPTFGTDPNDPWSAKANITETALLDKYLKSRGINPEFATKDIKVAHSKTNAYKMWATQHLNDPVKESISSQHTPTQKRLHALKKAQHMNKEIRVADGDKKLHEDAGKEILARHAHHHAEMMKAMKSSDKANEKHHHAELTKVKGEWATHQAKVGANKPVDAIAQDYKDQEKLRGIGHVRDHVEVDGETVSENRVVDAVKKAWKAVSHFDDPSPKYDGQTRRRQALKKKLGTDKKKVAEAKEANYGGDYQSTVLRVKAQAEKKPVDIKSLADRMQASYRRDNEQGKQGKPVKENLDPQAACNQPWDGANSPDDVIPAKRSAAKMVKSLVKKHVKEDMYDHEKEDKSVASYGKKPKVQNLEPDGTTKESPQAAAVLTGGKTLTGTPRDTIEIDPMMKNRSKMPDYSSTDQPKKHK